MQCPSFSENNLCLSGKYYASFSTNEVYLSCDGSPSITALKIDGVITSANILGSNLVVNSTIGTSIFSVDTKRVLFFFPIKPSSPENDVQEYHQGAAIIDKNKICVGHSDGSIQIFSVDSGRFSFSSTIPSENRSPVQYLSCLTREDEDLLISGHSDGTVYAWRPGSKHGFELVSTLHTPDNVVVTVASLGPWLIAGFTSGLVKFWRSSDFTLFLELQAHGRPLTAMAVEPTRGILATVAEDVVLNLWKITDQPPYLENVFSEVVGQSALLGVAVDTVNKLVKLSAYEQDQIISVPLV